jgi:hypothetical protein
MARHIPPFDGEFWMAAVVARKNKLPSRLGNCEAVRGERGNFSGDSSFQKTEKGHGSDTGAKTQAPVHQIMIV